MGAEATVFVVDDDSAVRDSLATLLESAGLRVSCYASAEAYLQADGPSRPGCLLLDLRMPGMNGVELLETLADRTEAQPVIILTAYADVPTAVRAVKSGAFDFVQKPCDTEHLLRRINDALALDARNRATGSERAAVASRFSTLTNRQRQVLALIISGKHNKEIAASLGIGERTVEVHRNHMMKKLAAGSAADLVRMVLSSPSCTRVLNLST